ncbi:Uncharacterised protein [uncultured archaeon]|nr:Uncharacterised protein [uncultured archaeon]
MDRQLPQGFDNCRDMIPFSDRCPTAYQDQICIKSGNNSLFYLFRIVSSNVEKSWHTAPFPDIQTSHQSVGFIDLACLGFSPAPGNEFLACRDHCHERFFINGYIIDPKRSKNRNIAWAKPPSFPDYRFTFPDILTDLSHILERMHLCKNLNIPAA